MYVSPPDGLNQRFLSVPRVVTPGLLGEGMCNTCAFHFIPGTLTTWVWPSDNAQ